MSIEEELENLGSKSKKISVRFSVAELNLIDARVAELKTDRTKYLAALIRQDLKSKG